MACCQARDSRAGYATPAAMVISLALALVGSAMVVRSVQLLQLARHDLERVQVEYGLAGAQLTAAAQVVRSPGPGPYYWTDGASVGWVEFRAEAEADKIDLDQAAALPDGAFTALGVQDPARLKLALTAAADQAGDVDVARLDSAALWRICATRLISPYGRADRLTFIEPRRPETDSKLATWRIGEVWRLTVTTAAGWRDDRIVRFTGDAHHPAAVVVRDLSRGQGDGGRCDAAIRAAAAV